MRSCWQRSWMCWYQSFSTCGHRGRGGGGEGRGAGGGGMRGRAVEGRVARQPPPYPPHPSLPTPPCTLDLPPSRDRPPPGRCPRCAPARCARGCRAGSRFAPSPPETCRRVACGCSGSRAEAPAGPGRPVAASVRWPPPPERASEQRPAVGVAAHLHLLTRPPVPGSPAAAQRPATRQSVPSPLVTCARPMPSSSAFQGGRLAGAASAIVPWVTRPLVGQVTSVSQTHALASTQRAQQASVHEQTGRGGAGAPLRTPAARRARACRAAAHSSAHLAGRRPPKAKESLAITSARPPPGTAPRRLVWARPRPTIVCTPRPRTPA
jgi:hypothetical protein